MTKPATKIWPEAVAIAIMVAALAMLWKLAQPEATDPARRLSDLPMMLDSGWSAQTAEVDPRQADVLRASELLLRHYHRQPTRKPAGRSAPPTPVTLFVAHYQSQRTGATYHSPKHCLPGSGWQITSLERVTVPSPSGEAKINEAIIQSGLRRQLILYWYQDRGRILASEYAAKVYLVWDALTQNRSDGALVRVSVPVDDDVDQARELALDFLAQVWPALSAALDATPS